MNELMKNVNMLMLECEGLTFSEFSRKEIP
jgi:hypothetical protein